MGGSGRADPSGAGDQTRSGAIFEGRGGECVTARKKSVNDPASDKIESTTATTAGGALGNATSIDDAGCSSPWPHWWTPLMDVALSDP